VFTGRMSIPIIDVRPYLDNKPDMHHSWSAVSSRARILEFNGNNHWQSIWMADSGYGKNARWDAFAAMDHWLDSLNGADPDSIPDYAADRCLGADGAVLHTGPRVWDGNWNNHEEGACSRLMPFNQGSRQAAGESILADTLMCQRIPVKQAIDDGLYSPLNALHWQAQLEATFPDGVCDYRQTGLGKQALQAN